MNMIFTSFTGLLLTIGLSTAAFSQGTELKIDPKLEQSKVAYAGMQAAFDFAKAFEKAHGKLPQDELVGFHAGTEDKEYEVGVYHLVEAKKLAANLYGCHFHFESDGSIENAHCHDEEEQAINDYEPAPRMFKIAELQMGLVAALDYYKGKHGNPDAIKDLKMWHAKKAIEFAVIGADDKKVYMMCHYHGHDGEVEMDCHGHSRPGAYEPGDA